MKTNISLAIICTALSSNTAYAGSPPTPESPSTITLTVDGAVTKGATVKVTAVLSSKQFMVRGDLGVCDFGTPGTVNFYDNGKVIKQFHPDMSNTKPVYAEYVPGGGQCVYPEVFYALSQAYAFDYVIPSNEPSIILQAKFDGLNDPWTADSQSQVIRLNLSDQTPINYLLLSGQ